jgi:transcriptional regulator with XRE-family HTH domain
MDNAIGQQIKKFRGKALTQQGLADKSGVSYETIRKLEQGRKGASVATLKKLARALDVDLADLVGNRYGMPTEDPGAGVVAIREALTSVDDLIGDGPEEPPVSLTDARRAVDYAWGAYWNGRYETLTEILPPGIAQLRATAHAAQNGEVPTAYELLARMFWVTGCTLVHLGHTDPAFVAIRSALSASERGNDPLLAATLRGSVAWQLLVQGRYEESHKVALRAAASVEPVGEVSEQQLALHIAGEAGEVASRLPGDTKWYECNFGPSQVVMQAVDINVSSERYPEALKAAKDMPNRGMGLTQVSQARHLLDRAQALTRVNKFREAQDLLLTAERVGGRDWSRYQTLMKQIVQELREQERNPALSGLAERIGAGR